jgi:hypothetical protein
MAKLFVLLKIKDASGIGWLQSYAGYGAYTVSSILDEYQDARLDLQKLNADALTHAQAKSAIFADAYRGYINLKLGTVGKLIGGAFNHITKNIYFFRRNASCS